MKKVLGFVLFTVFLSNSAIANTNKIKIVAFGDSLTSGYGIDRDKAFPARLESKLKEMGYNAAVINEGLVGETAGRAKYRIESILDYKPDVVILEHGMNDVFKNTPVEEINQSLDALIIQLKEKNIKVVLAGMQVYSEMGGQKYSDDFNAMYQSLAQKHNLVLYPFFLKGVVQEPALNTEDGVHPNPAGVNIIVRNFVPYLEKAIR